MEFSHFSEATERELDWGPYPAGIVRDWRYPISGGVSLQNVIRYDPRNRVCMCLWFMDGFLFFHGHLKLELSGAMEDQDISGQNLSTFVNLKQWYFGHCHLESRRGKVVQICSK